MPASDLPPLLLAPFIGSFLLVGVMRYPALEGFALGRSACPACSRRLAARDLVPIVSWAFLKGRCRHCATRIGWRYPSAELAALAIALWSAVYASGWLLWATCALGWTLLALSLIDLRCRRLPDGLTLPMLLSGLAVSALAWPEAMPEHLLGAVLGYCVLAGVGWLYRVLRGREGLGLGDAKLLAAGGAWLSWHALPSVLLIGAGSALMLALCASLAGRLSLSTTTRVPFGPYLAGAIWLSWLYGPLL